MTMSEEQQHKNTIDIRWIKSAVWIIGVLITASSFIYGFGVRSANKDNEQLNAQADLKRQSDDLKEYLLIVIQQLRTKDSTDISIINTKQISIEDEIRLLREQCKRYMGYSPTLRTGTLMHRFDKNGDVIPGDDKVVQNK